MSLVLPFSPRIESRERTEFYRSLDLSAGCFLAELKRFSRPRRYILPLKESTVEVMAKTVAVTTALWGDARPASLVV